MLSSFEARNCYLSHRSKTRSSAEFDAWVNLICPCFPLVKNLCMVRELPAYFSFPFDQHLKSASWRRLLLHFLVCPTFGIDKLAARMRHCPSRYRSFTPLVIHVVRLSTECICDDELGWSRDAGVMRTVASDGGPGCHRT
jgi:hypothetical protein